MNIRWFDSERLTFKFENGKSILLSAQDSSELLDQLRSDPKGLDIVAQLEEQRP